MKLLVLSALSMLSLTTAADIVCTPGTVRNVYIPKFADVATWDEVALRPYAQQLCELDRQREALQLQVRETARSVRENNFRVCNDLDENSQGKETKLCINQHANKINGLIDLCRDVTALGHNAHNVMIPIDEMRVENACLRGIALSLKSANL